MVIHKVRTLELGERGRGGSAKSIMAHVGGGGGSAYVFSASLLQTLKKKIKKVSYSESQNYSFLSFPYS